ncbi:Hypothetical predicted protein [Pelobates cultripes]|uniref:Uncharacterized protein n=1 Tax=Pelobates cultripes TaxID=61616 RepID=A0AAD1RXB8_PELCU|nr:Hypothetical predicted protein [Pelobates cultripes]
MYPELRHKTVFVTSNCPFWASRFALAGHQLRQKNMGKHSRKSRGSCGSQTRDIGFLLTQPSRPKMADPMAVTPQGSTAASEEKDPEVEERQHDPQWPTKTDITAIVIEIKAYIASEMAVLKTDLNTLASRMTSTEDAVSSLGVKQDTTAAQLHKVSHKCAELTAKVGQLEDMAKQRNLKIRRIPDTIDASELPQFIKRLLSPTLTPKQAKGTLLDGVYRLPGNSTTKCPGSRDVIISLRSRTDKDTFVAQVKG